MVFEIKHNSKITAEFHMEGRYWYFIVKSEANKVFESIRYQSPGKAVNIFYTKYVTKHLTT